MNQTNVVRKVIEEEFSKLHPDISIVFSEVSNTEISNKAMMEAIGKTGAYDVVMQNMTIPALTNINALEPLDDLIKRDSFPINKMIDNGIFYKGYTYGLPIRGDVRVLHYNQQMFKDAGLDPEKPPTTMEQFQQYAKILTRNGRYGVNRWPSTDNFTSLLFQFDGEILSDRNEPVYNSEAGIKAMQLMVDQYNAGYTDPKSTSWTYSDEIAGYLSGGAAMFDAWPARYIDAGMPEKSKIVGQSRVAALPGAKALVSGWYLVMYNTVKNRDAAWEFMKYVVDAKTQKEVILRGGDCNPTHLDVLNDLELQAKYEVLRAISNCFDRTKIYCYSTQYQTIRTHIAEALDRVFSAGMTPKQALDMAVRESRQALIDAGELK
jgi:sn-glycerol 3-phosphate transport system substrate-binding protein